VCITTNQPDLNLILTVQQHAVVSIQLHIVTCPTYPGKFIRDTGLQLFWNFWKRHRIRLRSGKSRGKGPKSGEKSGNLCSHLFDTLPAVSSGKVGEKVGIFSVWRVVTLETVLPVLHRFHYSPLSFRHVLDVTNVVAATHG